MSTAKYQLGTVAMTLLVCSALSIVGSLFIVCSILFTPQLRRKRVLQLIAFSSMAYIASAGSFWMSVNVSSHSKNSDVCQLQGAFQQLFDLVSIMYKLPISVELYICVRRPGFSSQARAARRRVFMYHVLCWVIGIAFCSVALSENMTMWLPVDGNSGDLYMFCWIDQKYYVGRFLLFYVPLFVVLLSCWVLLAKSFRVLMKKGMLGTARSDKLMQARLIRSMRFLFGYVGVFLVCWLLPAARRIAENFTPSQNPFPEWLNIIWAVSMASQGLLAAGVWALSPQLLEGWGCEMGIASWWSRQLLRCCKERSDGEALSAATDMGFSLLDSSEEGSDEERSALDDVGGGGLAHWDISRAESRMTQDSTENSTSYSSSYLNVGSDVSMEDRGSRLERVSSLDFLL